MLNIFKDCIGLTSVHISDVAAWCKIIFEKPYTSNPLVHAHHLYMNGEEIRDLVIPNDVTSIAAGTFYGCFGLTSATIPEGVSEIGERAFCECRNLKSVSIPSSVKSIGKYAFNFVGLTAVHITDIAAWCGIDFVGYYYWANPLYYAHHLYMNGIEVKDLVIPDGVTSIGNFAFGGCSGFTSVTIPNSVTSIGVDAFDGCDISTIVSHIKNPSEIYNNTFTQNTLNNATLYVPEGAIEKYGRTDGWKNFAFVETITELESRWFKLTYTIDGEEYKVCEVKYDENITPENAPEREGYTFSGWSEIPETMPPHDVTVTGSFVVNTYTLTYIIDGDVYKTSEVDYGTTITPEEAPTKTGYTFSDWGEIPATMPAHDVTVTGSFNINKYKLTYIVDGVEYRKYEVEYGSPITSEPELTRVGYTFSGWSEIPETMPAHDVTITGSFAINKYKLTYEVDGVEYKSYDVEYGAAITPETAPTKEGYTFSGWSEIPETMPAHDVTVTGTFSINKYKLAYMVDGIEYRSYDVEYGATITPETEPTKEGYTFSGWIGIPERMPAQDVTVTGTFSINSYKLTYQVDGEEYKTSDVEFGATITPETEPTKEGYTFSGWNTIPETMPAHDVMVTGTFSINSYKLIYMVDDEEYKSYDVEYGAVITPEDEPTKEGYSFSGWSDIPATMPARDIMVTGKFIVNKYKVNYYVDNNPYYTDMVAYGSTITPPTVPEREGYNFSWGYIPDTMPANEISIYGQYTMNTGIYQTISEKKGDTMIFTIDGKRVDDLKKGLNVIRMKNGKMRKVVVK